MRPGSLVECIDNSQFVDRVELKTPYTLNRIYPANSVIFHCHNPCLTVIADMDTISLEEVDGSYVVKELGIVVPDMPFPMECFRELLPPMENMMEQVNELLEPALV